VTYTITTPPTSPSPIRSAGIRADVTRKAEAEYAAALAVLAAALTAVDRRNTQPGA